MPIFTRESAGEIWERDAHKQKLCEEKGIELITIWEDDWINNCEGMKNMILEKLKKRLNTLRE